MVEVIITIIIYSLILTIAEYYKDNSGYYQASEIGIILAGPVMWIVLILLFLTGKILKLVQYKPKEKKIKMYSDKDINKIIKKVMNIYRKKENKDYIKLDRYFYDDCFGVSGIKDLMVKKPKYERINKKFEHIYFNQKEKTLKELSLYFEELSSIEYEELYNNENKPIYKFIE